MDDVCRVDILQTAEKIVHDSLYVSLGKVKVTPENFSQIRWRGFKYQIQIFETLRVIRFEDIVEFDDVSVTFQKSQENDLSELSFGIMYKSEYVFDLLDSYLVPCRLVYSKANLAITSMSNFFNQREIRSNSKLHLQSMQCGQSWFFVKISSVVCAASHHSLSC